MGFGAVLRASRKECAVTGLAKIYTAANGVDAHMLKALLAQEGIPAVVRGDDVVPLQGGTLFTMEVRPSVWVFDDDRRDRAQALADDYSRRAEPSGSVGGADAGWPCSCGETIETQFSECWNCGRLRADAPGGETGAERAPRRSRKRPRRPRSRATGPAEEPVD